MTREHSARSFAGTLAGACVCSAVNAQDAQRTATATPLTAPPPFKMIVKEERAQIEQTQRFIKRLKLTIEFAAHI
jgi:hypothetical protein